MQTHSTTSPGRRAALIAGGAAAAAPGVAPLAVEPKAARRMLSCGLTRLYELLAAEELLSYRYGRIVAVCSTAGEDLDAWMVQQGWALAYREYSTDYVAEEYAAQVAGLGIRRGTFDLPWEWRKAQRSGDAMVPQLEEPRAVAFCKVCRKGKACGDSCISRQYTCHKPPGCACNAN
jgi:hypothetical protein